MLGKSTHLQVVPQQSTQMQQTCGYRYTTKTSGLFLITPHGKFKIQVPLQKFPFLFIIIIP